MGRLHLQHNIVAHSTWRNKTYLTRICQFKRQLKCMLSQFSLLKNNSYDAKIPDDEWEYIIARPLKNGNWTGIMSLIQRKVDSLKNVINKINNRTIWMHLGSWQLTCVIQCHQSVSIEAKSWIALSLRSLMIQGFWWYIPKGNWETYFFN